jgi:hypothetical protein
MGLFKSGQSPVSFAVTQTRSLEMTRIKVCIHRIRLWLSGKLKRLYKTVEPCECRVATHMLFVGDDRMIPVGPKSDKRLVLRCSKCGHEFRRVSE